MRTYKGLLTKLPKNGIFVFGSNTQGKHGSGNALAAKTYFGAIYGQRTGMQGQSYAIITKDLIKDKHPSIPWQSIVAQIETLYSLAEMIYPQLDFYIAYSGLGTNLCGYTSPQLATFFALAGIIKGIPENIIFENYFLSLVSHSNNPIFPQTTNQKHPN